MRAFLVCVATAIMGSAVWAEPETDRPKKHLQSKYYTVTWGTPATFGADAELEIGDGYGHGGSLGWLRFRPEKDRVDVLDIQFDEGSEPSKSKWPPDRAPVTVKHAQLKPDAYAALLRDLAVVDAAKVKPVERDSVGSSSTDFWVYTRLVGGKKALIDLNWAGYQGSLTEAEYAKPQAAVALAREAVEGLDFKKHTLTDEERGWASVKFARDWKKFKDLEFHWWVRERYIQTIGVVGDKAALPVLCDILASDPAKDRASGASEDRCVYYAINAVTRLTKTDVRSKPVEEMDLDKTRAKVLEMLRERK
jgi:hypothetical protein